MTLKNICKIQFSKMKPKPRRRNGLISPINVNYYFSNDSLANDSKHNYDKSEEDEAIILITLMENEFLKTILTESSLQQLICCIYVKKLNAGEIIIQEGDLNNDLLITKSGSFQVEIHKKCVEIFKEVRIFEEIAIAHSSRASKTLKSISEAELWVLDCMHYRNLRANLELQKRDEIVDYLRDVPCFAKASDERLYIISDLFFENYIPSHKLLIKEGDIIENFLIVTSGSATIITQNQNGNKLEKLTKGCYFGESIVIKESLSLNTIIADPPGVHCLILSRINFLNHYEDFVDFLHGVTFLPLINENRKFQLVSLKNLKKIKLLGIGGFGKVDLVQDIKHKDNIFALKRMKKQEINGKSQIEQVYNEKDLQLLCHNEFIVKLYKTFRDTKYVYLLLEPCMGGDLWNLLRRQRKKCFDTDTAKFYTGCILEALNYLHCKDIVYRDLKPENIMVDASGYVKLTDFGFAKRLKPTESSYSFVGTAEYVAPELLQNLPHDKGVDYWALGIFLYEMLVGKSPFANNEHNDLKTYKAILRGIDLVTFPSIVSPRARNLIKKLCKPLSMDRLGCLKNGTKDIKIHSWFSKFDWEKLRFQQLEPPIRISLNGKTDTRYFENVTDNGEDSDTVDDFSSWDKDF